MNYLTRLDTAFKGCPRANFLPNNVKSLANINNALPIGFGQTNSQPYTVGKMLEWLNVLPGNKILDIGSGSGWTTALLSNLTGKKGSVIALEIVPELLKFGKSNCDKLNLSNVSFLNPGRVVLGYPSGSPYDRILVSASANTLPQDLVNQLVDGGKMVIPVKNSVLEVNKYKTKYKVTEHKGFSFVPLLNN